jgi:hypothetical protein
VLALRGDNQTTGSVRNTNYLGIMELLSQFDLFLCEHIKKYGNAGKKSHHTCLSQFVTNLFVLEFIKKSTTKSAMQPSLNNLHMMCTENDNLENTDFDDITHDFATLKCGETPVV